MEARRYHPLRICAILGISWISFAACATVATGKKSKLFRDKEIQPQPSYSLPTAQNQFPSPPRASPVEKGEAPATEVFGPSPRASEQATYGPQPSATQSIHLILGPGLAKGYAHVGVLRALEKAQIPIGAILGLELGGLIGAVYANSCNFNDFEWSIVQLKEETWVAPTSLFFNFGGAKTKKKQIYDDLKNLHLDRDLKSFKIPIEIGRYHPKTHLPYILNQGQAIDIEIESLFEALNQKKRPDKWPWAWFISEAKARYSGPILVVDVLSTHPGSEGLEGVIRPNLSGIDDWDFKKKMDAAFQGEAAVFRSLKEIRRWIGLPEIEWNDVEFEN